jgi:DNA invertase Pin-like site-specific DNA recombinase
MMKAVIYTRISSAEDRTGVERHAEFCQQLCELRGYEVVDTYEDNNLSATAKRPRYEQLLKDLSSGKFDLVVAYEQSRLARDEMDWLKFRAAYVSAGLQPIEFVHGGTTDLSSPQGQLTSGVQSVTNAYEKAVIKQRIIDTLATAAQNGYYHGGARPYGYLPVKLGPKGAISLEVVPDEAARIREAAQLILEGGSLSGICKAWNDAGVPTVTGARWSATVLRTMLMRPSIAGLRTYRQEVIRQGVWDPIVDLATWESLQAVLGDVARRPGKVTQNRSYPLKGILRCECGRPMVAALKRTRLYQCRKQTGGCGTSISAAHVEAWVRNNLVPYADKVDVRKSLTKSQGIESTTVQSIVTAIAATEARVTDATDAYSTGQLSLQILGKVTKGLEQEITSLRTELAGLRSQSVLDRIEGSIAEQWPSLSVEVQRSVLLALVDYVEVVRVGDGKRGGTFRPERLKIEWRTVYAAGGMTLRLAPPGWVPD